LEPRAGRGISRLIAVKQFRGINKRTKEKSAELNKTLLRAYQ
jgi:hypothetical protein